jgi:hypothetical protein
MTTLTVPTVDKVTNRLLTAGVVAAPFFTVLALAQAAVRPGYDLTRHPVSMLALGDLGWIQTTNFVVSGLLMLLAAVGLRRARVGRKAGTWGPILLATEGIGLLIASVFEMDPGDGFPIGTPAGVPATMSGHMILHNVGGSLTFFTMIAACFVLARVFGRPWKVAGRAAAIFGRPWKVAGRAAAIAFAVGLGWAMSGGTAGSLTLFLGVVIAWTWQSISLAKLRED